MKKMMNPELEVVRFGAEDVIATSGGNFLVTAVVNVTGTSTSNTPAGLLTFYKGSSTTDKIGDVSVRVSGKGNWMYYYPSDPTEASKMGNKWEDVEYNQLTPLVGSSVSYNGTSYNVTNNLNVVSWFGAGVGNATGKFGWDGTNWVSN